MRPASEVERRRLNETFAALCRLRSVPGDEAAIAAWISDELRAIGAVVERPDAAGNVLARIGAPRDERGPVVLLCAHLDTVAHDGDVEPVCVDGGWVSAGETILGADNKAAVATLLEVAHRVAIEGAPVGVELLFTTGHNTALAGAKEFDRERLRSTFGYVFDHASPIGDIVMASPTCYRIEASFLGKPAHAGTHPEDGRSAIVAAARAIVAMRLGRLDDDTTASVGAITGGIPGDSSVVAERASLLAEVRSLDPAKAETVVAEIVDHVHDAANVPECSCDVDIVVEKQFDGYEHRQRATGVAVAEQALRACGYEPRQIVSGGASDANALLRSGFPCTNIANGTERSHRTDERVSVAALEGMLDVTYALLDAAAELPGA